MYRIIIATNLLLLFCNCFVLSQECQLNSDLEIACGLAPGFVSFRPVGASNFCENQLVEFENTSDPDDYWDYFIIDFGDGSDPITVNNYANVSHQFSFDNLDKCLEGPLFQNSLCYLAVKDCPSGTTTSFAQTEYAVLLGPVADFFYEQEVCINEIVSFMDDSCNAEETVNGMYSWDFDNDGVEDSSLSSPIFNFSETGIHMVELTVSNECGVDSKKQNIFVVGYPEAEIDLGISGNEICAPDRLNMELIANEWVTGPRGSFYWEIDSPYNTGNIGWCYTNDFQQNIPCPQNQGLNFCPCVPDSLLNNQIVDSLIGLETLDIWFSRPGEYIVTVVYENICESSSVSETIIVLEPPSITGLESFSECDDVEICYSELASDGFSINGDFISVEWTFTGADIPSFSSGDNPDFGCVTFTSSGTMQVTVTGRPPCGTVTEMINVNISQTIEVSIDDIVQPICQNADPVILMPEPIGGSYMFNNSEANFITGDILNPNLLNPGNYEVLYVLSDNPACPSEDSFQFTIQEGPSISLGSNPNECESIQNFNPQIDNIGGVYNSWNWQVCDQSGNIILNSTNEQPEFSINDPGEYMVKVELFSDLCGSVFDTSTILIQRDEQAVITEFETLYCQGSGVDTLDATPSGGTWSGSGIISGQEGIFNPSTLQPNTYTIIYSISEGACSSSDMVDIEVVASESYEIDNTFICISDGILELNPEHSSGIYNGDGINLDGNFDPNLALGGINEISYSFIDLNGCDIQADFEIEVDTIPTLEVNDTIFICIGNQDINLDDLLTINTNGAQGDLIFSGEGIQNSTGVFNGAELNEGFYTINLRFETRSCFIETAFIIELADRPELILPEDMTVCVSDQFLDLNTFVPQDVNGGVWTSSNCSIDQFGVVDISLTGEVECIFTYTVAGGTSCEVSDDIAIQILDLSNDISVSAPNRICFFNGVYQIPSFSPEGGIWSGDGVVDVNNGIVDLNQLVPNSEPYTFTYCIESSEIDCDACQNIEIIIDPLPIADFSFDGSPCQGNNFTLDNESIDASSYSWDFGDSNNSNSFEPTHAYSSEGDFDITLIAFTEFNCTDTIAETIHVTPPPTLQLDVQTIEGCAPLEIEYTNNSFGENFDQYWLIDGIDTLFSGSPSIVLDSVWSDSIITLELVVFNDCETIRSSHDILVHPYPIVDFGINDDEGCSPDTVIFMNTTLGLPDNFTWDLGNGNTSNQVDPEPQVYTSPEDSTSFYTISLFAENMCGSDSLSKEITVFPNMVDAFFEIDELDGCPPLAIRIENYATVGATVSYDFGDGGTGFNPDTTYIYDTPGDYVITQYASLCGLDSVKSNVITVHPLPIVDFTISAEFACIGDTVLFNNFSENYSSFEWHFGNGDTSTEFNPVYSFDSSGIYNVKLIAFSEQFNCPDSIQRSITIPELPIADFSVSPPEICPGEIVDFTNLSIGATSYEWDFGDNSGSEEFNPIHQYTTPGNYTAMLTVFDGNGCTADTSIFNILVHPSPQSSFAINGGITCQFYDTLQFVNESRDFINSIWSIDNVFYSDQNDDINLVFDEHGYFDIKLVSINAFNCKDSISQVIEVLPSPVANSSFLDIDGCEELMVIFQDLSINADLTTWIFDENNSSNDISPEHIFLNEGNYQVVLIAGNTNGCPDDSLNINVDVYPMAESIFEINPFDSCGVPLELSFINSSLESTDYFWNLDSGETSTLFEPNMQIVNEGIYEIELIVNNSFNCRDTSSTIINIYPDIFLDFELPIEKVCEGDSVLVTNNSVGANQYFWILNDDELVDFPLVISEAGIYELKLIGSFDDKCLDTIESESIIQVFESPISQFSYVANQDENIIGDVSFVNLSIDADKYLWEFGDGNSSNEFNPEHEYSKDTPATVCLYAFNTNNGLFECVDKSFDLVHYETINTFFAPNALSPNKSFGNNEVAVFKPKGIGLESYELNIYSPWGDKVATLNKVLDGEPIDFWDGSFNGLPAPQGAYLWTANVNYLNGNRDFYKGTVTVIR